jgi:hypothetical protein
MRQHGFALLVLEEPLPGVLLGQHPDERLVGQLSGLNGEIEHVKMT